MSNHAVKISAGSALILILVVAAIMGKKPSETSIKAQPVPASNTVPSKSPSAEAMIKKTIKNEVNKVATIAPAHLTEAERLRLFKHLELFQELDVKVLMNPSEKERYVALLSDRDIQALIKRTILTANTTNIKLQNSSVEFLVSAIESNVDVSQLMKEIISDSAIESTSAPQAQRQVQAELKAELIYSWSSYSPRQVQGIEALLPGPVSQRIWSNIQYTHANNAEESLSVN